MASKTTPRPKETANGEPVNAENAREETAQETEITAMLRRQREEIERLQARQTELQRELAAARAVTANRMKSDKQIVEEAVGRAIAEGKDPWTVTVSIRSRLRKDTTEKHYWLSVNGRTLALPADDQYHEMKLPFAEALVNAMNAERFVEKFADEKIQVYDPITNPHPVN